VSAARTRAKYAGFCGRCDHPFEVGAAIFKLSGHGWGCRGCAHSTGAQDGPAVDWTAVLQACPTGYRRSVYRALAQAFHPDHGGDAETMRDLIAAFERARAAS